jgi:RNA polymerase sigma-70 factor, ECF subfamily
MGTTAEWRAAVASKTAQGHDSATWIRAIEERYGGALFVFACRSLGDREAAEEVVQDTLVRAWRSADSYDPERGSLGTWLFAIARNLVIDQHRRRQVRPRVVATVEEGTPYEPSTTAMLDRAMDAWQVAEALQRLSPEHRSVIVETYYRGASTRDAAVRLGIPAGTVKSRLYYGLRALRLTLEEMGVVA